jgi:predicted anti-sigma-YlaC factor YlaD
MTQPIFRDVEMISAYLDGQLSRSDAARLEARIKTDDACRRLLDELSQSRTLLRSLPARRAPRNFTLTPKMAGLKPPVPRAYPIFRLASAVMALLFLFTYAANISVPAYAALKAAAPAVGFGRGGGGGSNDANPPAANMAPMAAAPSDQAASPTASPEPGLFAQPAPTQPVNTLGATPTESLNGLLPATQTAIEAGPTYTQEPAPTEMIAPPGSAAKIVPTSEAPLPERTPLRLPVPAGVQFGLLGLAVMSGMIAYFVRARSDTGWFKARALVPARRDRRQVITIALIALAILALILSIVWVSTNTFFVDTPQPVALGDKSLPPQTLGDKAVGPAVTGGDKAMGPTVTLGGKGAGPATGIQSIVFGGGLGYGMNHAEPSGLLTSMDFPANIFPDGTALTYTPEMGVPAPTSGTVFGDRSFLLSVPPEAGEPRAPFTITLDYGDGVAVMVDQKKLALEWWSGSEWVDAASTCSPSSTYERLLDLKRLRVNVCKLGSFILVAP